MEEKLHLLGCEKEELEKLVGELGEPRFRAQQIFRGLHQRRLDAFSDFTDMPKAFRALLAERFATRKLALKSRYVSSDGTRRYLFETDRGNPVETVYIPTESRDTICFSSQSGCALKCDFCLTAKLGFLQNLSVGEIVEQIVFVLNDVYGIGNETPYGTNLVAMGAGEPFHNLDNLAKAVALMSHEDGLFIVPGRITVSTAGVVPKFEEFARLEKRPNLAISLSAANDPLRDVLMPINTKWNLDQLMRAAFDFQKTLKRGERFTFEYVLLQGVNDSEEDASQLAQLLRKYRLRRAKINLIPHNSAEPLAYQAPEAESVLRFKKTLENAGVSAYLRRPRGNDIFAACGQLAAREIALAAETE
ncbi:MAG: 23S rRNA (adenine(2503)-C(2))-methyltransferase RlmN [Pyrinomonadaceae bacterium]